LRLGVINATSRQETSFPQTGNDGPKNESHTTPGVIAMQILKLSVSLPDDTHPDMELRLSSNDSACDVVIALPAQGRTRILSRDTDAPHSEQDDYVLGGYAGI
jgi:hypothetical protein